MSSDHGPRDRVALIGCGDAQIADPYRHPVQLAVRLAVDGQFATHLLTVADQAPAVDGLNVGCRLCGHRKRPLLTVECDRAEGPLEFDRFVPGQPRPRRGGQFVDGFESAVGTFAFGPAVLQLQKPNYRGDRLGAVDQKLRGEGVVFAEARVARAGRT